MRGCVDEEEPECTGEECDLYGKCRASVMMAIDWAREKVAWKCSEVVME